VLLKGEKIENVYVHVRIEDSILRMADSLLRLLLALVLRSAGHLYFLFSHLSKARVFGPKNTCF
jgi:hypothetical protein